LYDSSYDNRIIVFLDCWTFLYLFLDSLHANYFLFLVCFQEFWSCCLHVYDCFSIKLNKILVLVEVLVHVSCLSCGITREKILFMLGRGFIMITKLKETKKNNSISRADLNLFWYHNKTRGPLMWDPTKWKRPKHHNHLSCNLILDSSLLSRMAFSLVHLITLPF